jgi:hypothetical protein
MTAKDWLVSPELEELAPISKSTLDIWSRAHFTGSARGGGGFGSRRAYSPQQAFAVYAAMRWRAAGADPVRVGALVHFLGRIHPEHLEAELAAGRTLPVLPCLFGGVEVPTGGALFVAPAVTPEDGAGVGQLIARVNLATIRAQYLTDLAALAPAWDRRYRGRRRRGVRY